MTATSLTKGFNITLSENQATGEKPKIIIQAVKITRGLRELVCEVNGAVKTVSSRNQQVVAIHTCS
ncbi:hypothetical protein BAC3_02242 [uncultured bacterium]|nr:hypothetical protein BAC3_02242 [uncultured bacterium]